MTNRTLAIISDTHRQHRAVKIPACDILIHCGDFCSFQQADLQTLNDVDAWFAELPAKHILCIGGNHDFLLQRREFRFAHAQFLEDTLVEIAGLSIYGSPWCPDLSAFAYYATSDQLLERWKKIPSGIDILITHTPPHGVLDLSTSGVTHLGCPHLRDELKRIRPRLHVFGHIHASHGVNKTPATQSINAAVVGGRDFEVRHPATAVELELS